jgi:hypothetical protein
LRFVLVISAILFLLIAPLVVVSNVLAQRPPPPPPPQHPGEATVVVVELVQLVVMVEVTSQVTDVIPAALVVSSGDVSPLALLPSETGLGGTDGIGLLTGNIAMLAAAVYVTLESSRGRPGSGMDFSEKMEVRRRCAGQCVRCDR